MKIRIGIITVPADSAQKVCDMLVDSGIYAIWNFAPVHLKVPDNILVQRIMESEKEMRKMTKIANKYEVIDNVEKLEKALKRLREAQSVYATYTQEQVDKIFFEAAMAANKMRIPLAKMAVEETGMGVVEDKVIKNHYASEYIYNAYNRAFGGYCGGYTYYESDIDSNL